MGTIDERAVAFHEAGHAVALAVQGVAFNEVSIVGGDDSNGFCAHASPLMYECESSRERRQIARAMIVASFAGLPSERMANPSAPDWHADQDDENAFDLSCEYHVLPRRMDILGDDAHHAFLDRLRREAARLVNRHRHHIEAVAHALMERKSLSSNEVESLTPSRPVP